MIDVQCPGCDHALRIAAKFAGLKGRCRYCQTIFRVPTDVEATPGPAPAEGAKPDIVIESKVREPERGITPLVDPGADRISTHRYGRQRGTLMFPLILSALLIGGTFGGGVWLLEDGMNLLRGQTLDSEPEPLEFETVTLAGVPVAAFGASTFVETKPVVPSSGKLMVLSEEKLIAFEAQRTEDYSKVVTDYRLSLTKLGWDFVVNASSDGDWTDLHGLYDGKNVHLRITTVEPGVRIVFTTPKP